MSLVGTRPILPDELEQYELHHRARIAIKPGIGDRIASICASHDVTVDYAFQDINDIPGTLPEGRTKPWGTGQAVLVAKDVIKADLFSDL